MKIHIKDGRLIDPKNGIDAKQDVFIAAGKIVGIGQAPVDFVANQVIDASKLIVCPGLIDLSARLREPGYEYKATLESELRAAVAGGVTSLACPPDTDPVLDEPGLVEMLTRRAQSLDLARVHPLGALTVGLKGERLAEMAELTQSGCVGFFQGHAAAGDALCRDLRLHRVAAARGPLPRRRWCGPRGRGGDASRAGTDPGDRRDRGVARDPRADDLHRRARAPRAALERGRRGA